MGAGDINLKTGEGSSNEVCGNINIIASTNTWDKGYRGWNYNNDDAGKSKEINFGFDVISADATKRQVSLQLKKSKNSTRLVSTVPFQVTTVQYSSDDRIKKDITNVDTGDLLDRMRRIELREYGYTDEWRQVRDLEENTRVRGVNAQELRQVFPEHIEVLDELALKDQGIKFKDFHQVDKQGLVMDGE